MIYQHFYNYISSKVDITDDEFEILKKYYRPFQLPKKAFLLKKGEICIHSAFVVKGALRKYLVNDNNEKLTIQFAIENWWISEFESLFTKTPTQFYIQAVEDCELLIFTAEDGEKAREAVPTFSNLHDVLMNNASIANQKRLASILTKSAEERYVNFLNTYPAFNQRFPQHMIATYLGIKPETLSRLRRKST